jgi:hypothetical protein
MPDDKQKQPGIAPPVDDNIDDMGRDVNDKSNVPGDKATVDKTRDAQKASAFDPKLHTNEDAPNSRIDDL